MEYKSTDLLIIGSEGTGARAALVAAEQGLEVLVVTKGLIGKSGATLTADADVDIDSRSAIELFGLPGDPEDSPEKFAEDMCRESEYLSDQALVKIHCEEAPQRIRELADWGARVSKLTQAPGHRYPRGLWIPGTEFPKVFAKKIAEYDNIKTLSHFMATDLLLDDGRAAGVFGLHIPTGECMAIKARAVILCTGGAMRMYPHTTAPQELTGDGMAMAFRAGAALVDMEFPMFLPYTMVRPQSIDGVDFTYSLSAYMEAHALNRMGERYMKHWDPERMERSTRDVNSIAAMMQVLEGKGSPNGGTYISVTHIPQNLLDYSAQWFPDNMANWRYGGFNMKDFLPDLTKEAVETIPAAHFWNGGIKIDAHCATSVPGLFAAGEGTGGIMGANRISGNALTMTQVWGHRAGHAAAEWARGIDDAKVDTAQAEALEAELVAMLKRPKGPAPIETRLGMQALAWDKVGVVRTQKGLEEAEAALAELKTEVLPSLAVKTQSRACNAEWVEGIQLRNLALMMELVAESSLLRTESRGALYRRDCPKTDNAGWLKNIVLQNDGGRVRAQVVDANLPYHRPKAEVRPYGRKG